MASNNKKKSSSAHKNVGSNSSGAIFGTAAVVFFQQYLPENSPFLKILPQLAPIISCGIAIGSYFCWNKCESYIDSKHKRKKAQEARELVKEHVVNGVLSETQGKEKLQAILDKQLEDTMKVFNKKD